MYNLYSQIVYALKAADVRTVIIGGKPVMEDRKMLTLNEASILEKPRKEPPIYRPWVEQAIYLCGGIALSART